MSVGRSDENKVLKSQNRKREGWVVVPLIKPHGDWNDTFKLVCREKNDFGVTLKQVSLNVAPTTSIKVFQAPPCGQLFPDQS